MRKIAVALIAFLTVALSANSAEIPETTKSVLAKIEKANESLNTIVSPVTETRTLPNGKKFVSNGNFYFSSPDLLAIHYTNPAGDYLISNATEIAQKRKQGKNFRFSLKKNETMQALSSTLLWCVSGKILKLAETNNAAVATSEAGGMIQVVLTAEVKGERGFKKIELSYDKATLKLKSMAMTDKNNIVTKYTMDKPQYATEIDAALFQIK